MADGLAARRPGRRLATTCQQESEETRDRQDHFHTAMLLRADQVPSVRAPPDRVLEFASPGAVAWLTSWAGRRSHPPSLIPPPQMPGASARARAPTRMVWRAPWVLSAIRVRLLGKKPPTPVGPAPSDSPPPMQAA